MRKKIGINRTLAEDALRTAHDELGAKVGERTAELAQANAALQSDIAERARIEIELKTNELQLRNAQQAPSGQLGMGCSDGQCELVR